MQFLCSIVLLQRSLCRFLLCNTSMCFVILKYLVLKVERSFEISVRCTPNVLTYIIDS